MKRVLLIVLLLFTTLSFSQKKKNAVKYKSHTTVKKQLVKKPIPKKEILATDNKSIEVVPAKEDRIITTQPEYSEGILTFRQKLASYISFPEDLYGTLKITIDFIIENDGTTSNLKINFPNDISETSKQKLEAEIKSFFLKMEKWKPATENDRPVKYLYHLPVTFNLE